MRRGGDRIPARLTRTMDPVKRAGRDLELDTLGLDLRFERPNLIRAEYLIPFAFLVATPCG